MPSYEDRLGQMETVLKSSVGSVYYGEQHAGPRTPSAEVLKELSDSQYIVYDVLPAFFNHSDPMVSLGEFITLILLLLLTIGLSGVRGLRA
jgi:acetyl-CoA carboxylase / biotin carboxylase 1